MNSKQNIAHQFYQNLGKVFYAIAAADNSVKDEEFNALQRVIKEDWSNKNLTGLDFQSDEKHIVLETFDWLRRDKEYNAEACYSSFVNFKKQNESFFTDKVNTLILKTAGEIAASFSRKNKSELIMLAQLNIELKKNKK